MDYKLSASETYDDTRGKLVVFLKEPELPDEYKEFGQIYFITFSEAGIVRGNHYHKFWREWFGIVHGQVEVALEDVRTKERQTLTLDASSQGYLRLETGPYVAHAFRSLTPTAALLNYANTKWNDKDTFPYTLLTNP